MKKNVIDIMISYSTRRKEIAEDIRDVLSENGFSVWMAPKSIPSGSYYDDEIYAAIDNCEMTLFVMCEESLSSQWCINELRYAVGQNKRVLPVQIVDLQNPYDKMNKISRQLKRTQILALFPDYKKHLDEIVEGSKYLLTASAVQPKPYPVESYCSPNESFVGREKELENLHRLILEKRIVNLYGIGGIGKSALLRSYLNKYCNDDVFRTIHVAKFTGSICETVARIPFVGFDDEAYLRTLPQNRDYEKTEELFRRKVQLLGSLSSECLLIIDGADYIDENDLLPLFSAGCAIVVSSRNAYPAMCGMELLPMSDGQLTDMFFHYSRTARTAREEKAVSSIIGRSGGHTLMLKLIACYCYDIGLEPSQLGAELLKNLSEFDNEKEKISSLFDFSRLNPDEMYSMKVLALFPNGVTKGKLQKIDRTALRQCARLSRKGWVHADDTSVGLHQIVQECVILRCPMTADSLSMFLTGFVENFRNIGFDNVELLLIIYRIAEVVSGNDSLTVTLLNKMANCICDITYSDTFHVSKEMYESQDMNFFNRKNDECVDFAAYEKSCEMNERALKIALSLTQKDHAEIAYIYSYIGSSYFNRNMFAEATDYQKKALDYAENNNVSEEDFRFAVILNRLGLSALEIGEYATAEQAFLRYKKMAETQENFTGNVSMSLFNLGNTAFRQGDFDKAEKYYLQSAAANKDDPEISFGLSELFMNLAKICKDTERDSAATQYYLKACAIKENVVADANVLSDFRKKYDKIYL